MLTYRVDHGNSPETVRIRDRRDPMPEAGIYAPKIAGHSSVVVQMDAHRLRYGLLRSGRPVGSRTHWITHGV